MTTDKTPATLATAKHGGCVQLGKIHVRESLLRHLVRELNHARRGFDSAVRADYVHRCLLSVLDASDGQQTAAQPQYITDAYDLGFRDGQALSAQPSPGGQGDADPDVVALDVARRFTPDGEPQRRARLQVAIVTAIAAANAEHIPVGYTLLDDIDLCRLRERAELPMRIEKGELWHWQGDGHDFPESLACPVVMTADTLRALIAARQPVGEPVANPIHQLRKADGSWVDQDKHSYDYNVAQGHRADLRVVYAAPPAQAVDLDAARHEGHDCAIRYVLGYLNGTGDMASTQYGEILNGCGRESIIRSAIRDGELEFTGLGQWVAKYGTDAERALIGSHSAGGQP